MSYANIEEVEAFLEQACHKISEILKRTNNPQIKKELEDVYDDVFNAREFIK